MYMADANITGHLLHVHKQQGLKNGSLNLKAQIATP